MTTYPIIHEPSVYQYDEGVFVWFDETGGVGGASNYFEEAQAQMKRYADGMGSIDRTEQLAATCEELKLELDNELQYQVSMEYLYALDEEVISDLKKHIEQLNAKLTAATDDAKEAEAYAEELEDRNKELTLQLLATSGQAADALDKLVKAEKELNISRMASVVMDNTVEELEAKLTECEARLSKAVESIKQSIKLWEKPDGGDRERRLDNAYDGFELLCKALAELEK
jgi:chromosome segregation ATPase